MPTALLPMTDYRYPCFGGPLDAHDYDLETIQAAQSHGFQYVPVTVENEWGYRFVGVRPRRSARAFLPLRPKPFRRWRVTVKR